MRLGDLEFQFPVFKFLPKKFAVPLLEAGQICIPTMYEFRNDSNYKGKILDRNEGKVWLHDKILLDFNENISTKLQTGKLLECQDCYVYCTTGFVLSDSIRFAVEEEKDSCVLIKNFEIFCSEISDAIPEISFYASGKCDYTGRHKVVTNSTPNSIIDILNGDKRRVAFVKPRNYSNQMEVRAIWQPRHSKFPLQKIIREIPRITSNLINLDYSKIDVNALQSADSSYRLGALIHKNDGSPSAIYELEKPYEIFSPIIYQKSNSGWMLGFHYKGGSSTIKSGTFRNGEIGAVLFGRDLIVCSVRIENVKSIELLHITS
jgi:hypothetical protein